MKKEISVKLQRRLDELRKDSKQTIARYTKRATEFAVAEQIVAALDPIFGARVSDYLGPNNSVVIIVRVESFRDTLPILEVLMEAGYGFDSTEDWPDWNERSYISPDGITLKAELIGQGTEGCKRVVTGWRVPDPVPIYAFDCNEIPSSDAAQPKIEVAA